MSLDTMSRSKCPSLQYPSAQNLRPPLLFRQSSRVKYCYAAISPIAFVLILADPASTSPKRWELLTMQWRCKSNVYSPENILICVTIQEHKHAQINPEPRASKPTCVTLLLTNVPSGPIPLQVKSLMKYRKIMDSVTQAFWTQSVSMAAFVQQA